MNDAFLKPYSAVQMFVDGFSDTASLPWVLDIDSCIVLSKTRRPRGFSNKWQFLGS